MNILYYYKEKSKIEEWYNKFKSSENKGYGKLFGYTTTNFRYLKSFKNYFLDFLPYKGLNRSEWIKNPIHNQEMAKQWVTVVEKTKLFMRSKQAYELTSKGETYKKIISDNIDDNTLWLINFYFFMNAYFEYTPKYIFYRTNEIISKLKQNNVSSKDFFLEIEELLESKKNKIEEIVRFDCFWQTTFLYDDDFNKIFESSSKKDKEELFEYVIDNKNKLNFNDDLILNKTKSSGTYVVNTFLDEVSVLYMVFSIFDLIESKCSFEDFNKNLIIYAKKIKNINESTFSTILFKNESTFRNIYNEITNGLDFGLNLDDDKNVSGSIVIPSTLDLTDEKDLRIMNNVSNALKRIAKEKSGYKCQLEEINNCIYFTSKDSGKNYLEIHHLIPREFSNEFENSIEIIENYVALCPSCHRLLHLGDDRERKPALNLLYSRKSKDLESKNLKIDLGKIYEIYNLSEK